MDSTSIELPGSVIASVSVAGDVVRVRFEPAFLIKMMTGSTERTRWRQDGELVFQAAEIEGDMPALPAPCAGGDVGENVYTYRDMIPVPLASRGRVRCDLRVAGSESRIRVTGAAVELRMEDVPRYIEHLRGN